MLLNSILVSFSVSSCDLGSEKERQSSFSEKNKVCSQYKLKAAAKRITRVTNFLNFASAGYSFINFSFHTGKITNSICFVFLKLY